MGFKEEVKVHLSTRSAEVLPGFSKATWKISDPVRPPNALYRMKIQLSNVIIPNSFDKVSSERGNNKLTILAVEKNTVSSFKKSVENGDYITISVPNIENPTPQKVFDELYKAMKEQLPVRFPNDERKPIVRYDPDNGIDTMKFEVVDWDQDDDLPDAAAPELPGVGGNFLLLTTASAEKYGGGKIAASDVALADVLGFDDSIKRWYMTDATSIQSPTNPDFIGTQFIKMMTNLNINNIDPNTLQYSRILGIIPVTEPEGDTGVIYMAGGLQAPQYQTIGDPELKNIMLELRDDQDRPLNVHDHWYVELTVMYEEEEKTDVYRGLGAMAGPAADVGAYDPNGYTRLGEELRFQKRMENIRDLETQHRDDNYARSGTKRRML